MSAIEDDQFLLTELQSRSSVPSLVTTASSSEDSDDLSDLQSRRSLDAGLRRLSCISSAAKFAMKLNQIHHVKICATYDESEDGPTVYVMNVYLRYVQKGLPPPAPVGESEGQRKKRLRLEREIERPVYQVEHRYSAFRELRRRIMKTVNARGDSRYHQQCTYCSRVKFIDSSTGFPPRVPNRGLVATCTGWRQICTHFRKRQLESFLNQLLKAAKDLSYRTGSGHCERFLVVSQILNSFLSAESMRATENVW
ncbi:Tartrate-resistant acid phosphatase type 5 [Phytophthora cinnamomi]|uniref:Tartrate-resistant acid phosphatase type 5 n=1 Tax=Phytophthora cinnamomi TaxID=4785 RepID=UPI00355ACBBB|nr:Tartrate-resistant acid phosphatase type 5 [Phytophthora cinnamomi]